MISSNWLGRKTRSTPVWLLALLQCQQRPGPLLARRVAVLHEQQLALRLVPRHQHEDRVLLRQAGQVVQVAVLPVLVVDVQ
jgi:hypothetical protein